MRAIYNPDFSIDNPRITDSNILHHFVKVLRIKTGESIIVLAGNGYKHECQVEEISKKEIRLKLIGTEFVQKQNDITLALGITKKDALDTNIKQAVELGVSKIILVSTEYSQKYDLKLDRIERLLVSAIEQSNEPYFPKIVMSNSIEELGDEYDQKFAFISEIEMSSEFNISMEKSKLLVIIGPEGGFSPVEIDYLGKNAICIKLKTNILKSTTAVPMAIGYIHGKCN